MKKQESLVIISSIYFLSRVYNWVYCVQL